MNEYERLEKQYDKMSTCRWEQLSDVPIHVTDCRVTTSVWDKAFNFCPYCGKKLSVI